MKSLKIAVAFLLLAALALPFAITIQVQAQQNSQKNEMITSIPLETFETNDNGWHAVGSKYTMTGFPQWQEKVENWPTALYGQKGDPNNKYSFGVRTSFYRMGYNYTWVLPKDNGKNTKIPGIAKAFYIWLWGANFNYDMELQITDFSGLTYTLPMGKLNYLGWKIHRVDVPGYIPQLQEQLPRIKNLKFERFTIWSQPGAPLKDFYIYFDLFSVLTDIALETYDGDALNQVDQYWTSPQTAPQNNDTTQPNK